MTFDIDFMNYHWKQQIISSATGHIFPIFIGLTSYRGFFWHFFVLNCVFSNTEAIKATIGTVNREFFEVWRVKNLNFSQNF